ncbi:hypothetical protein [Longimicrobium sp.]|uniref:hypothetical protein n=1 Tax=Longimicrobium sp. TaxID=2029185 RepID=UPI002E321BF8|nr:hypothetical protein [Longimicrobium sp.]HEX6040051.1 hypothetical protein [Longimicrobium sp.]
MRILRRSSALIALLLVAACDGGGTLPATAGGPVVGEWSAPTDVPLVNPVADRAEWRLTYRDDGTYTSQILWFDDDRGGDVVYRSEASGEYRVEAGALSQNVRTWRHWNEARGTWQSEYVAYPDQFGPPVPYAVEGSRLTLYYSHSYNENGVDGGAWEAVFTRR